MDEGFKEYIWDTWIGQFNDGSSGTSATTQTWAIASASAAISRPVHSCDVTSPTSCWAVGVTTFVGPGSGVLLWQDMVGTNDMQFCKLHELCYLPQKVANCFFTSFTQKISKASTSHLCPPIVATWMSALIRDTMLLPEDIAILLQRLQVSLLCSNMQYHVVICIKMSSSADRPSS